MLGLMRRARNTTDRWMVWTLCETADLAQIVESTLRNQGTRFGWRGWPTSKSWSAPCNASPRMCC